MGGWVKKCIFFYRNKAKLFLHFLLSSSLLIFASQLTCNIILISNTQHGGLTSLDLITTTILVTFCHCVKLDDIDYIPCAVYCVSVVKLNSLK